MIIKMKIIDTKNEESTMLFGTSYKHYLTQIASFFYRTQKWIDSVPYPTYEVISIEVSKSEWKSWGGLKWCEEKNFQQELNREGVQRDEPDNKNPRQYADMKFIKEHYHSGKISTWLNNQYRGREIIGA